MIDLITGATGFFGLNLCARLLAEGNRVRVLLRDPSKRRYFESLQGFENLEFADGDILDKASLEKACEGTRYVYHAAAAVSSWQGKRESIFDSNVGGVRNIVDAAKKAGSKRLVYISTVDAYGLAPGGAAADENTTWNYDKLGLSNPYSDSKYQAHLLAEKAAQDQDIVIVCPGYMIGPMDIQLSSNKLLLLVAKGELGIATAGGNSFVHVHDVVDCAVAAAAKGKQGRSYIAAGENLSYKAFFEHIAAATGKPKRFAVLPPWIAFTGGFFGELAGRVTKKEPNLHLNVVRMANILHYYKADRAQAELGYTQRPVSQAISDSLAWFREKGML